MQITDVLHSARFVVDKEGEPVSIILDIDGWMAILSMLEEFEDSRIVRERWNKWRSKEGWTSWEQFEKELDENAL
uniref:Antitoxin Phd_YefM, type II toxin-antitoxin system n=1 Tax=Candidatus Kentrum sp. UNK TaxID=2126344 RepID=A0A451AZ05_9GAMM|nr:MAG: hypothetical protein BECKUNK1418G_GA0071005_10537 [Candidatus Kentron sp. UNK]VFK71278.1 MAG: hypothetical protein BECKUNK1418H_GA0071006_105816 [Candidatus Kentron sp. UNK]